MATQILGLYAAGTGGTENAAASFDIPQDGVITGVDWDCTAHLDADDETFEAELSFIGTHQLSSNDVRGRLSSIGVNATITTSGIAAPVMQKMVGPMEVPVAGGERIYLHINSAAGVVSDVRCCVHLDVAGRVNRRSQRRR